MWVFVVVCFMFEFSTATSLSLSIYISLCLSLSLSVFHQQKRQRFVWQFLHCFTCIVLLEWFCILRLWQNWQSVPHGQDWTRTELRLEHPLWAKKMKKFVCWWIVVLSMLILQAWSGMFPKYFQSDFWPNKETLNVTSSFCMQHFNTIRPVCLECKPKTLRDSQTHRHTNP